MNNKENGVGSETVIQVPMAAQIVPEKAAGNRASSTSRVLWIGAYAVQPREVPGYWFYFPSMAIVALALFYRHWRSFPPGRKCLVVLSALGLSTILALG